MMLVFFNNLRLKHGCLFQFENNQFYLIAIGPNSSKNTKCFGNGLSRSVSLLTSALNFQTIVTGTRQTVISRYVCR